MSNKSEFIQINSFTISLYKIHGIRITILNILSDNKLPIQARTEEFCVIAGGTSRQVSVPHPDFF